MKKLLSLPPNLVECFHDVAGVSREEYFCTSDPVGARLGSGGGTNWLMDACHQEEAPEKSFAEWLSQEKRILLHAGGQSHDHDGTGSNGVRNGEADQEQEYQYKQTNDRTHYLVPPSLACSAASLAVSSAMIISFSSVWV